MTATAQRAAVVKIIRMSSELTVEGLPLENWFSTLNFLKIHANKVDFDQKSIALVPTNVYFTPIKLN